MQLVLKFFRVLPSFHLKGIQVIAESDSFIGESLMDNGQISLDPSYLFGSLQVGRADFLINVLGDMEGEAYLGSTFRGLLGWQLQDLSCPYPKHPPCRSCIIKEQCPAFSIIEGKSRLPGLADSPRGYILYPEKISVGGASYRLRLTLLGDTTRFYPLIRKALANGQKAGLGRGRARYVLHPESDQKPEGFSLFSMGEILEKTQPGLTDMEVHIVTPLRLRKKQKYLDTADWPFLLESAARRLEALSILYGEGKPLGKVTWQALASLFSSAPAPESQGISWREYQRYSNRQKKKVPMGGIVGKAVFAGAPGWFIKWLQAACLVHAGKGAAMGLGRIEIFWDGFCSSGA